MMEDSFRSRIGKALEKENEDKARLGELGCESESFGQGQLSEKFRDYLHKHPKAALLYLRWLSDLLVFRPDLLEAGVEECAWMVDSKYSPSYKHHYSHWLLEKAAHKAHRLQQEAFGLPVVYIWPDGCTCSYVNDLPDEELIPGPPTCLGSGTSYWKVPKYLTRPLEEIFGNEVPGKEQIA